MCATWPEVACTQDDGELRLQRILCALKSIADALPQPASEGAAAESLSPPRQEELTAAAGFQLAVLRMFGAHDKVPCHLSSPHRHMQIQALSSLCTDEISTRGSSSCICFCYMRRLLSPTQHQTSRCRRKSSQTRTRLR